MMKDFDIELVKQGEPVCTRDGKRARIVCFDRESGDDHFGPIIALIKTDDYELVYSYYEDGKIEKLEENSFDLMMVDEKKEGWIDIYKTPSDGGCDKYIISEELYNKLNSIGILDREVRGGNVGTSDYSKHIIQPWSIWKDYNLNPWDADIVKRVLRTKKEPGKNRIESRIMDYEKIIHICRERIRQLKCDKNE